MLQERRSNECDGSDAVNDNIHEDTQVEFFFVHAECIVTQF